MDPSLTDLPTGLEARPATTDDVEAVWRLIADCESADHGAPDIDISDILGEWQRPSFRLATDSLLIFDGDRLVAHAELCAERAGAHVHPDVRRRGIGTAVRRWIEEHASMTSRAGAPARIGQTVSDANRSAAELLSGAGYQPLWTSWILEIDLDTAPSEPTLPDGLVLRTFSPDRDDRAAFEVIDDAFAGLIHRPPRTFEDWAGSTIGRGDFDPSLTFLVTDGDEIVGAAYCIQYPDGGWVEQLAVRDSHRRRGIGRALLQQAFSEFHRRGEPTCGLSTGSLTGALSFYEHVGMHVERSYTHYAKELAL